VAKREEASSNEIVEKEVIKNPPTFSHVFTSATSQGTQPKGLEQIIDINRFSSLVRLLRVTVLVIRFVTLLKNTRTTSEQRNSSLSGSELSDASLAWIKEIQAVKKSRICSQGEEIPHC